MQIRGQMRCKVVFNRTLDVVYNKTVFGRGCPVFSVYMGARLHAVA